MYELENDSAHDGSMYCHTSWLRPDKEEPFNMIRSLRDHLRVPVVTVEQLVGKWEIAYSRGHSHMPADIR